MRRTQALAILLFCLLGAGWLRIHQLAEIPPGLHYDEAANGILASEIGLDGARPIFIPSYTGKEPLYFYLAGGVMRGVGASVFSLRLTSAYIGLLTIAGIYRAGISLFRDRQVGLFAAIFATISFWHLLFSRLGFRAISQPLLQTLSLLFLFAALRKEKLISVQSVLAGICLALTAYTYLSARILPLLLLPALLPLLLTSPKRKKRLSRLSIIAGIALLCLLPLLNYFRLHPDTFWTRIRQVAPAGNEQNLLKSYAQSIGMIGWRGDPYWRFNIPDMPLFGWVTATLTLLGWLMLWGKKCQHDQQRAAQILLIVAPFIMILPTALASNEITPSNLRAIGLIPFIFYLPAFAIVTLLNQWKKLTRYAPIIAITLLIAGTFQTYHLYFNDWATRQELFYENESDLVALAHHLDQTDTGDDQLFVSAKHYRHPTLAFLSDRYDEIHWLPNGNALVMPANETAQLFYPHSLPPPAWAQPFLPNPIPNNNRLFTSYRLNNPLPLTNFTPITINFDHILQLTSIQPASVISQTVAINLNWHVTTLPPDNLTPFFHLQDEWGRRWSQAEPFAYPSEQWQIDDQILLHAELPVPPATPPGDYQLRVGWFNPTTGEQLPILDELGRFAGNGYTITPILLPGNPTPPTTPPPVHSDFTANGLRLLGYAPPPAQIEAGKLLQIPLWWQTDGTTLPDWQLQVTLGSLAHQELILWESRPVHDSFPFPTWRAGTVQDIQAGRLPAELPTGTYSLSLWLTLTGEQPILVESLGEINVTATDRLFVPPAPISHPVRARFGDEITLLGYELDAGKLTLFWQAEENLSADYTVFVHLLDESGVCCLWQVDQYPQGGSYATSRWLAGEVVVDELVIGEMPAGSRLEVGLYIAENGKRLQLVLPDGTIDDKVDLE